MQPLQGKGSEGHATPSLSFLVVHYPLALKATAPAGFQREHLRAPSGLGCFSQRVTLTSKQQAITQVCRVPDSFSAPIAGSLRPRAGKQLQPLPKNHRARDTWTHSPQQAYSLQ